MNMNLKRLPNPFYLKEIKRLQSSSFLPKIMKTHFTATKILEFETNSSNERDSVTLHEFLRITQFQENVHPFQNYVNRACILITVSPF
jgi:hypothetical protein